MSNGTHILACVLVLAGAVPALTLNSHAAETAQLPPPSDRTGLTYEADIKPLFERSCTKCHGEEKQKAKLRLDSLEHVLAGAEDEKILVAGKSAESLVVLAVAHATEDEDHWMPPAEKAEPFSKEEIGLLRAWIDQGAK
jgi:hypothetical protein